MYKLMFWAWFRKSQKYESSFVRNCSLSYILCRHLLPASLFAWKDPLRQNPIPPIHTNATAEIHMKYNYKYKHTNQQKPGEIHWGGIPIHYTNTLMHLIYQSWFKPIRTAGGHICHLPPLPHMRVRARYTYERIEKAWLFPIISLEKVSTLFTL